MLSHKEQEQAFKIAVQTERDGYNYYTESIAKTDNPLLKDTLRSLADDEIQHEKFLTKFYEGLTGRNPEELQKISEDANQIKSQVKTIFHDALKKPGEQVELSETDRGIYQHAIDFEKKGIAFYADLEEKSEDETTAKFFHFLKEMEEVHLDILEKSVLYLEDPQRYYSENENWILEG